MQWRLFEPDIIDSMQGKTICPKCDSSDVYEYRGVGIKKPSSPASVSYAFRCKSCEGFFNKKNWTDEEIEEMKLEYLSGGRDTTCPICKGKVTIKKLEGEKHLKKKYVSTHLFLVYECNECKKKYTKTYRKSP